MAAESIRITGTLEPICNINNGSQKKLFSLSSSYKNRRHRLNVSSSLSDFFGGVRISRCSSGNVSSLQHQRKNKFSVFAMAADGNMKNSLHFISIDFIKTFLLCGCFSWGFWGLPIWLNCLIIENFLWVNWVMFG